MRPTKFILAAALLAVSTQSAAAAARPITGQALVFTKAFDVDYWDSVNGLHKIAVSGAGATPSITTDGRYVAYGQKHQDSRCYDIVMVDTRTWKHVPLPSVNNGSCPATPRVSGDGHYLVWSGPGHDPGNPSDIYLYDVRADRIIDLPAIVNSESAEESPTLSDNGRYLTFVSGRLGIDGNEILIADLGVDLANVTAGTVALVPTPGLAPGLDIRAPYMSGDGSTVAFMTGRDLAGKVNVYSLAAGALDNDPALQQGNDTADPAVSDNGQLVIVSRQLKDLGSHDLWVFDRTAHSYTPVSGVNSSIDSAQPGIAAPVQLVDRTPPTLTAHCSRRGKRLRCTVTSSEAAGGSLTVTGRGVHASRRVVFATVGKRTVKLVLAAVVHGKLRITVRLKDLSGNVTSLQLRL